MKLILLFLMLLRVSYASATNQNIADAIVGHWMSAENNIEVEVIKSGEEFKARVLWFDDSDDKSSPMNIRTDSKNPDKLKRTRKVLGLEVMNGLIYDQKMNEWEHGKIYDASSGKDWDAKLWLTKDGILKVRGFWHFEFLGQDMSFKKVK